MASRVDDWIHVAHERGESVFVINLLELTG
jgi:hypothetical protein